jgi:hypothetical protein
MQNAQNYGHAPFAFDNFKQISPNSEVIQAGRVKITRTISASPILGKTRFEYVVRFRGKILAHWSEDLR